MGILSHRNNVIFRDAKYNPIAVLKLARRIFYKTSVIEILLLLTFHMQVKKLLFKIGPSSKSGSNVIHVLLKIG